VIVAILEHDEIFVELWYIRGSSLPYVFPNKGMAEEACKNLFPKESAQQRYSRIYYRRYYRESALS
jgi:hypothetical protein